MKKMGFLSFTQKLVYYSSGKSGKFFSKNPQHLGSRLPERDGHRRIGEGRQRRKRAGKRFPLPHQGKGKGKGKLKIKVKRQVTIRIKGK